MTEYELFQSLRPLYPANEYALLPQVANGTGSNAKRHADAFAMSLWPSRGLHLHGFEIKSYKGDWLREKSKPEKAEVIASMCNYWWIVAAGPFIEVDEMPEPWGLLVWDKEKSVLVKKKSARFREAPPQDMSFIAAILRKAQEVCTPAGAIQEAKAKGYKAGVEMGELNSKHVQDDYRCLQQVVNDFRKASGVEINKSTWNAGDIGAAVNQIINGTAARERNNLIRSAKKILKDLGSDEVDE